MDWEHKAPFGIKNEEVLAEKFLAHCEIQLSPIQLRPILSKQRFLDVFCAWKEDLNRSKSGSFRSETISPDHIKSAAHLTYWIRRAAPIIELPSIIGGMSSMSGGMYSEMETLAIELDIPVETLKTYTEISEVNAQEITLDSGLTLAEFRANRERVFAYGNELFAFTFGFHLAKVYEEQKLIEQGTPRKIIFPEGKYIEDLCYFFKFKSVSPHSIDLIYRALLKNFV